MDCETKWIPFQVKGVDREKRSLEGYASTSMPDYEGEVIIPSAWKESLKAWKKQGSRPKFLAYHKHALDSGHSPVIGTIESMEIVPDGLRFEASFAQTELGQEHLELYATKAMDAFSVGFIPQERELEPEKIGKILEKNGIDAKGTAVSRVTTKAHVLEVSAVCLGMNMGALVKSTEPIAVKALERLKIEGVAISPEGKAIEAVAEIKGDKVVFGTPETTTAGSVQTVEITIDERPGEAGLVVEIPHSEKDAPVSTEADRGEALESALSDVYAAIIAVTATTKELATVLVAHASATEAALKAIDARVNEIKSALDDMIESKSGEPAACACAAPAKADAKGKTLAQSYLADIFQAAKAVKETLKR